MHKREREDTYIDRCNQVADSFLKINLTIGSLAPFKEHVLGYFNGILAVRSKIFAAKSIPHHCVASVHLKEQNWY